MLRPVRGYESRHAARPAYNTRAERVRVDCALPPPERMPLGQDVVRQTALELGHARHDTFWHSRGRPRTRRRDRVNWQRTPRPDRVPSA